MPGGDGVDLLVRFMHDPFSFYVVARAWSCLAGLATIPLTAALAARVVGPDARGLAALVVATCFLCVRESHYGSVDATATALFTATLLVAAILLDDDRHRRVLVLVAGALAGLTAAFRYQLGVVALAVPVAGALGRSRASGAARATGILAAALVALGVFAIVTPYSLLELGRVRAEIATQLRFSYFGFGAGLSLTEALPAGAGWAVCGLAAIGVLDCGRRRPAMVGLILITALPYAWALARASRSFVRYTLPLLPLCAVFSAAGILGLAGFAPARWRRALVAALVVVAVVDPLGRAIALDRLLARPDTRNEAGAWLRAHAGAGERVWISASFLHARPTLPLDLGLVGYRCGPEVVGAVRARLPAPELTLDAYGAAPDRLQALRRAGGLVVTAGHPELGQWAATPPEVQALLEERGRLEARFVGVDRQRAPETLFDPIDANFVPLCGFDAIDAPGPNLAIWRLPPTP
jgi:hypothetical protein